MHQSAALASSTPTSTAGYASRQRTRSSSRIPIHASLPGLLESNWIGPFPQTDAGGSDRRDRRVGASPLWGVRGDISSLLFSGNASTVTRALRFFSRNSFARRAVSARAFEVWPLCTSNRGKASRPFSTTNHPTFWSALAKPFVHAVSSMNCDVTLSALPFGEMSSIHDHRTTRRPTTANRSILRILDNAITSGLVGRVFSILIHPELIDEPSDFGRNLGSGSGR